MKDSPITPHLVHQWRKESTFVWEDQDCMSRETWNLHQEFCSQSRL